VNDVEFSRDGRLVVTASSDDDGRVWDPQTGKKPHRLIGQFGAVQAASFSPDGRWVVSAGPTTAILWQPAEHFFFYLRGHSETLTSASFAPDGRRIVTSSIDGTVRSYDCQVCVGLDGLIALGEARLARLRGG
jgi:WD40 repeat protein